MNIEAIDFLNQLNEYGKIDYPDYSYLHDLLTSDEGGWEYAGVPVTSAGEEWVARSIESCKELVTEHSDPSHWVHEKRNSDLDYVVSYRVIRRRKAGPWEKVEA